MFCTMKSVFHHEIFSNRATHHICLHCGTAFITYSQLHPADPGGIIEIYATSSINNARNLILHMFR